MTVPCKEKMRLLAEYQNATEVYSKAVSALSKKMGDISAAEYDNMRNLAEQSRYKSLNARRRFEEHLLQHGC
jgi:hypothetical protein